MRDLTPSPHVYPVPRTPYLGRDLTPDSSRLLETVGASYSLRTEDSDSRLKSLIRNENFSMVWYLHDVVEERTISYRAAETSLGETLVNTVS